MKASLTAAVAAADITPPLGPILQGHYNNNPSHAVLRPLEMRTLIVRGSQTSACIITLDAIGVTGETTSRLRKLVSEASGVPEHNTLIAASHTHCAPAVLGVLGMSPDAAFMKLIDQRAAETAAHAAKSLQPATFALGCGSAGFNINRRPFPGTTDMAVNYAGIIDRRVRILRIDNAAGQALAVLFHFSCHPTSKSGSEGIISPDYPGFARTQIEQALGCSALFMPGCFANIRPNVLTDKGGFGSATEEQLIDLGQQLARPVTYAAKSLRTEASDRLKVSEIPLAVPYQAPASLKELDEMIADPQTHPLRLGWAQRLRRKVMDQSVPAEAHSTMQAIRVGPLQLVTIPGEPVQEIGHAIEKRLRTHTDAQEIWPVGYSNDMLGYLCTERHKSEGGYEPNAYPYFDMPARFDHEEDRIVDTAAELVK